MGDITFDVIDLACQAADQSFFPPRVAVTTKSTTQIATVLGYSEYIASTPPKKYHNLTWAGTSEQIASTFSSNDRVGHAKYEYGGTGSIDSKGVQISSYSKNLFTPCPASNFVPLIDSIPNFGVTSLTGYCWSGDPQSCPVCNDPPQFKADVSANLTNDFPADLLGGFGFNVFTPTTATNTFSTTQLLALKNEGIGGVTNVPLSTVNGITAPWIEVTVNHNYTATLDTEYTDAEALANAEVIISNGKTAENFPRTTGFVSRFTSVVYTLLLSNLILGSKYVVSVLFVDQSFVKSTRTYNVTATATTATVIDVIPQPLPGNTTTLFSATVAFAP